MMTTKMVWSTGTSVQMEGEKKKGRKQQALIKTVTNIKRKTI